MTHHIRKAVFPVGGLGTRLLPATKAIPKEMLTVIDKPLIQYAVEEARAAGVEQFIFVLGRSKSAIEDYFDACEEFQTTPQGFSADDQVVNVASSILPPAQIVYTRQQMPLGLGHAVWCARNLVGRAPFAVLLVDDVILADKPCLQQLIEVHAETDANVVAAVDVPREDTHRFGMLDIESDDGTLVKVKGVVEKPDPALAPSTTSITGRYILKPEIFDCLSYVRPGAGNEIQLTDGLGELLRHGQPLYGVRFKGSRFDCGDRAGLLQANIAFALTRRELASTVREMLRAAARGGTEFVPELKG